MKYWEFLIQKEGDDTWLPLETQQVEILEGRYRVVAHTDRLNTPMEIKVSQLDTSQMPPRKRVRKRTGETNDAGLVVVMPYVHLKPGQWDLSCSSVNLMGDLMGDDWRYQVQLQVFAPTDEDWSSEWPVPEEASGAHSQLMESNGEHGAPLSSQDTPLVKAQAQLQDNLQRQGQTPTEDTSLLNSVYQVSLRQQAFLARRNQSMTIMGQVQALSDALPVQGASQLWLRLQNPETAQVIMEAHRPLSLERLPADFKVKIQLPATVKTRVVLGEVSLRTAPLDGEPSKLLTSTGFTITAGIAQLIDEIANRDPGTFEEELVALSGQAQPTNSPVEPGLEPELISPILDPTRQAVMPAVGVVLPPQLNQEQGQLDGSSVPPSRDSVGDPLGAPVADQPELPAFPQPPQHQSPLIVSDGPTANVENVDPAFPRRQSLVAQPAQFMGTSIEDDDLEASQIAALLEDIDGDLASQPADINSLEPPGVDGVMEAAPDSAIALPGDDHHNLVAHNQRYPANAGQTHQPNRDTDYEATPETATREAALSAPAQQRPAQPPEDPPSSQPHPIDERSQRQQAASQAFKSLKLKDHFWKRLSTLTHESRDEAAQLAENMEAAGVSPRAERSVSARSLPPFPVARPESLPANSEVVIYDQPSHTNQADSGPAVQSQANPLQTGPNPVGQSAQNAQRSPDLRAKQALTGQDIPIAPPETVSTADISSSPAPALGADSSASTSPPPVSSMQAQPQVLGGVLPEGDLPEMELPVISVPSGDFVAGDIVTITVRTRPSVYKPFIKLWMIDRQSRTLVGEPQLLTSLKPDALGYLEGSADLRVPMGCLDVQVAAIAVDMATQQESNKAIVNRHVVPANQSPPPLRKFHL